jgi:hypothetical protein
MADSSTIIRGRRGGNDNLPNGSNHGNGSGSRKPIIHQPIITGSGRKAALNPAFKWVNTTLGNIKSAITGTYRAIRDKHVPRYLAEFEYRFNRRYDLAAMMPRLGYVAVRTPPMLNQDGWSFRKTRHRGLARVGWMFTLTATAYNLVRLPKLVGAAA